MSLGATQARTDAGETRWSLEDAAYFIRKAPKRCAQGLLVLFHGYRHMLLTRDIRRCATADMPSRDQGVEYKYLGAYVARPLSLRKRRDLLQNHYRAVWELRAAFPRLGRLFRNSMLWSNDIFAAPKDLLLIRLDRSRIAPMEGELQLQFTIGGRVLATLTFLFGANVVFGDDRTYCLIGGIQGGYHCQAEIRRAAKLNGEIDPFSMLMIAVRSLASALGVETIAAVSSRAQAALAYAKDQPRLDYDQFWIEKGATLDASGFYLFPREEHHKPISEVVRSHRHRALRKRERKHLIGQEITDRIRDILAIS